MKVIMMQTIEPDTCQVYIPNDQFVSLAQTGMVDGEKLVFQVDLNGTWVDIVPEIALEALNNLVQIGGPATYRIVKGTTSSPVTVYKGE